jgi:membrane protein
VNNSVASATGSGSKTEDRPPLWLAVVTAGAASLARARRSTPRSHATSEATHFEAPVSAREDPPKPADIPARGWLEILKGLWHSFTKDRLLALAAGVTFYAILAIFPAIAALVSLYGLFADPKTIANQLDFMTGVLPGGGMDILRDELTRVSSSGSRSLGFAFLASLAVSLWSANAGIKALFDTLNLVFKEDEKRGIIKLNAVSLAFTLGTIVFALLALGAIVVVPIVFNFVGLGHLTQTLLNYLRWPILLIGIGLALSLIYRFGPSRTDAHWHWITLGSACGAILWLFSSLLFSWYAANFGSYNKTYGALGAAIGFMIWIWISVITVLLGAELDAQGERHDDEHRRRA